MKKQYRKGREAKRHAVVDPYDGLSFQPQCTNPYHYARDLARKMINFGLTIQEDRTLVAIFDWYPHYKDVLDQQKNEDIDPRYIHSPNWIGRHQPVCDVGDSVSDT